MKPGQAKRYYLGIWGRGGDEQWLPEGRWDELADPKHVVERGTKIFAGFDSSWVRDSTALVAVTAEGYERPQPGIFVLDPDAPLTEPEPPPGVPHVFTLGVWEPVDGAIPRDEVVAAIKQMFDTYDVQAFWADPFGWIDVIGSLQTEYGEQCVVQFPTNQTSKWSESCNLANVMVKDGAFRHDGNEALARHVRNAIPHKSETAERATFGKSHPESKKKVDAACRVDSCVACPACGARIARADVRVEGTLIRGGPGPDPDRVPHAVQIAGSVLRLTGGCRVVPRGFRASTASPERAICASHGPATKCR